MSLRDRIVEIISDSGAGFVEKKSTIRTSCPVCGRDDKFSILKDNGACICYRASCEFGKRWFEDWIRLTLHIPYKDARDMLHGSQTDLPKVIENIDFHIKADSDEELPTDGLMPILFPEFHMLPLSDRQCEDGLNYVLNRGISRAMIEKYNLVYSKLYRRVYIPVIIDGICYGYQGRHVDDVPSEMRMRNNEGFSREALVMFADNMADEDYAVLAEGPFDALKFELVGGNIATMGKVVTAKQLGIIKSYGIRKLYLALDEDAASETNGIVQSGEFETYLVKVPESCKVRCAAAGKKADFGECTFEECLLAFQESKAITVDNVQFYVKAEG